MKSCRRWVLAAWASAESLSPDGTRILFTQIGETTFANDLMQLRLDDKRVVIPLVESTFSKNNPSVSPDGRWLAYESTETGEAQIFVQPFPDVSGGRWKVSTSGGRQPQWARNGEELFYFDRAGFPTSAQLETQTTFASAAPKRVLNTRYATGGGPWTYDVAADGQRFLMLKTVAEGSDTPQAMAPSIVVVLNWQQELQQRVPTR